jgi:hypothetical protein
MPKTLFLYILVYSIEKGKRILLHLDFMEEHQLNLKKQDKPKKVN